MAQLAADFLLSLAVESLYQALWSDAVVAELVEHEQQKLGPIARARLASNLAASNLVAVEDEPDHTVEIEQPIILASAHRHGVSEDDMLHALRFAIHHVRQDDDMVMFIGPNASGDQLVEVGVVIWWGGELAIVHAMRPARDKYLR